MMRLTIGRVLHFKHFVIMFYSSSFIIFVWATVSVAHKSQASRFGCMLYLGKCIWQSRRAWSCVIVLARCLYAYYFGVDWIGMEPPFIMNWTRKMAPILLSNDKTLADDFWFHWKMDNFHFSFDGILSSFNDSNLIRNALPSRRCSAHIICYFNIQT